VKLGGNHGNLPAGAKASVGARIAKANSRTSDLEFIIEELKAAGAISPRQLTVVVSAKGIKTAMGRDWSAMRVKRVGSGLTTCSLMEASLEVMVSGAERFYG
jgi:hypothetical protein